MRLELTGRHLTISPATRALVEQRVTHTQRLLNERALSAHVVLTRDRARIRAELTLHARRERFLHAEATGSSPERAVAAAAAKIERQARTLKGKLRERQRRHPSAAKTVAPALPGPSAAPPARTADGAGPRVIRSRRRTVKPMSVEDAAAEIHGGSDPVIVFRNATTETISVMFRRADGNLGLIEPDV
jgi:ribosomal subunit interface protein